MSLTNTYLKISIRCLIRKNDFWSAHWTISLRTSKEGRISIKVILPFTRWDMIISSTMRVCTRKHTTRTIFSLSLCTVQVHVCTKAKNAKFEFRRTSAGMALFYCEVSYMDRKAVKFIRHGRNRGQMKLVVYLNAARLISESNTARHWTALSHFLYLSLRHHKTRTMRSHP